MKFLPLKQKIYFIMIYLFTIISLFAFINCGYICYINPDYKDILFFSILTALTETCTVAYRSVSFSTTFAITVASFILFDPLTVMIILIIGFSCRVLNVEGKYRHILNTPIYGTVFNFCVLTLPIMYGNYLYRIFGGSAPVNTISNNVCPLIAFCITAFLVNTILISILYSLVNNKNIIFSSIANIKLMILNILAMAPLGFILAFIYQQYRYLGVILFIFPIVLARYTFSHYIEAKSQYIQMVDVLMHAMEARDKSTEGHSQRVAKLSQEIAKELKYSEWKIEVLNIAALLHDVGKIGIDDSILNKPGKLTDEEYNVIKQHPEIGYNILKNVKNMDNIIPIVRYHHERYDGKGYPCGKSADELSLDVFIIQLADSVDAMSTDRPYRKALTEEQIIDEIKRNRGTQFHPVVTDAYLRILDRKKKVN